MRVGLMIGLMGRPSLVKASFPNGVRHGLFTKPLSQLSDVQKRQ